MRADLQILNFVLLFSLHIWLTYMIAFMHSCNPAIISVVSLDIGCHSRIIVAWMNFVIWNHWFAPWPLIHIVWQWRFSANQFFSLFWKKICFSFTLKKKWQKRKLPVMCHVWLGKLGYSVFLFLLVQTKILCSLVAFHASYPRHADGICAF